MRVLDTRMEPPLLAQLPTEIAFKGGDLQIEDLQEADVIILSLGLFARTRTCESACLEFTS